MKRDPSKPSLHLSRDWLEEELAIKRRTLQDIGEECGVSRERVRQAAKKFGIVKPRKQDLIDIDWLRQERDVKHRCYADLAVELGVSITTVAKICHYYGIAAPPRLTPEEVLAHGRDRCNKYYHRMYESSPAFRAMKKASTLRWRAANPERYNAYQREYSRRKKAGLDSEAG